MNKDVSLLFTGDFCPTGRFEEKMNKQPQEVLGSLNETFQNADFCFTNLEAPITKYGKAIIKTGPALKTNPEALQFLKAANVNYVTLANNHILDYGENGLIDTINALKKYEINFVGAGKSFEEASKPIILEKNSLKFGILNFAENEWSTTFDDKYGASPINEIKNFNAIKNLKEAVDYVIVVTHGGHEMFKFPSPRMKELFRFYVDCGASAVINHHTHCTSGFEVYKDAPIFYSLGNFIFDHKNHRNKIWNKGMAVNLIFSEKQIHFQIIHFDQANEEAIVKVCEPIETNIRNEELLKINKIIANDNDLNLEFQKWVNGQKKMYKSFIEPHTLKWLAKLQSKKLIPSLWRKRKKLLLLNLVKCEAHQDILVSILKDEVSHSQK